MEIEGQLPSTLELAKENRKLSGKGGRLKLKGMQSFFRDKNDILGLPAPTCLALCGTTDNLRLCASKSPQAPDNGNRDMTWTEQCRDIQGHPFLWFVF